TLKSLADIGVIFLLFDIGLRVKTHELLRSSGTAAIVALSGILVSFLAGLLVLRMAGVAKTEALFIAVAMISTSAGITASALAARGWLHDRAAGIILAAAVIDDILGLIVLSLLSSLARGRVNTLDVLLSALLPAIFAVVLALWGPAAVNRILP